MPLPNAPKGNPYSATPFSDPSLYDHILLDKIRSPGLCKRTSGGDRTQQSQDMQAPGFGGGYTVMRFQDLMKLEYQFWVRSHEGFQQLETWIKALNLNAIKRPPRSYQFQDPWLNSQGVGVVAVISAGPIQQPTAGVYHFYAPVKFTEYAKMRPVGGPVSAQPQTEGQKRIGGVLGEIDLAEKALAQPDNARRAYSLATKGGTIPLPGKPAL